MRTAFLALLCLFTAGVDAAADEPAAPGTTRVTLEVGAEREVNHDAMQAMLTLEADDNNLDRLADTMKQKLDWAVKTAQESPYVQVETGDYRTYPIYDRYDPYRFSHWYAVQELRLKSTQFSALNHVLGNLQGKVLVKSVDFSLSRAARRDTENSLLEEAMKAFRERAQLIQKSFSAGAYRIVSLEIHVLPLPIPPVQTPKSSAGTEVVSVSLVGSIELK
jgi:predicted secreted protein